MKGSNLGDILDRRVHSKAAGSIEVHTEYRILTHDVEAHAKPIVIGIIVTIGISLVRLQIGIKIIRIHHNRNFAVSASALPAET